MPCANTAAFGGAASPTAPARFSLPVSPGRFQAYAPILEASGDLTRIAAVVPDPALPVPVLRALRLLQDADRAGGRDPWEDLKAHLRIQHPDLAAGAPANDPPAVGGAGTASLTHVHILILGGPFRGPGR